MSEDRQFTPELRLGPSHYYGDIVRILFVVAAGLLLVSQFVGTPFITAGATVFSAVGLIIAAGLTNPVQTWIHWVNVLISAFALVFFGTIALDRFQTTGDVFGQNFVILILVGLFIATLYSATKTLRGVLMRGAPVIK